MDKCYSCDSLGAARTTSPEIHTPQIQNVIPSTMPTAGQDARLLKALAFSLLCC